MYTGEQQQMRQSYQLECVVLFLVKMKLKIKQKEHILRGSLCFLFWIPQLRVCLGKACPAWKVKSKFAIWHMYIFLVLPSVAVINLYYWVMMCMITDKNASWDPVSSAHVWCHYKHFKLRIKSFSSILLCLFWIVFKAPWSLCLCLSCHSLQESMMYLSPTSLSFFPVLPHLKCFWSFLAFLCLPSAFFCEIFLQYSTRETQWERTEEIVSRKRLRDTEDSDANNTVSRHRNKTLCIVYHEYG